VHSTSHIDLAVVWPQATVSRRKNYFTVATAAVIIVIRLLLLSLYFRISISSVPSFSKRSARLQLKTNQLQ
jgi:hypothetical protein